MDQTPEDSKKDKEEKPGAVTDPNFLAGTCSAPCSITNADKPAPPPEPKPEPKPEPQPEPPKDDLCKASCSTPKIEEEEFVILIATADDSYLKEVIRKATGGGKKNFKKLDMTPSQIIEQIMPRLASSTNAEECPTLCSLHTPSVAPSGNALSQSIMKPTVSEDIKPPTKKCKSLTIQEPHDRPSCILSKPPEEDDAIPLVKDTSSKACKSLESQASQTPICPTLIAESKTFTSLEEDKPAKISSCKDFLRTCYELKREEEKQEAKSDEKKEEKSEEKSDEKPEEKSEEKSDEKPEEKKEEKPSKDPIDDVPTGEVSGMVALAKSSIKEGEAAKPEVKEICESECAQPATDDGKPKLVCPAATKPVTQGLEVCEAECAKPEPPPPPPVSLPPPPPIAEKPLPVEKLSKVEESPKEICESECAQPATDDGKPKLVCPAATEPVTQGLEVCEAECAKPEPPPPPPGSLPPPPKVEESPKAADMEIVKPVASVREVCEYDCAYASNQPADSLPAKKAKDICEYKCAYSTTTKAEEIVCAPTCIGNEPDVQAPVIQAPEFPVIGALIDEDYCVPECGGNILEPSMRASVKGLCDASCDQIPKEAREFPLTEASEFSFAATSEENFLLAPDDATSVATSFGPPTGELCEGECALTDQGYYSKEFEAPLGVCDAPCAQDGPDLIDWRNKTQTEDLTPIFKESRQEQADLAPFGKASTGDNMPCNVMTIVSSCSLKPSCLPRNQGVCRTTRDVGEGDDFIMKVEKKDAETKSMSSCKSGVQNYNTNECTSPCAVNAIKQVDQSVGVTKGSLQRSYDRQASSEQRKSSLRKCPAADSKKDVDDLLSELGKNGGSKVSIVEPFEEFATEARKSSGKKSSKDLEDAQGPPKQSKDGSVMSSMRKSSELRKEDSGADADDENSDSLNNSKLVSDDVMPPRKKTRDTITPSSTDDEDVSTSAKTSIKKSLDAKTGEDAPIKYSVRSSKGVPDQDEGKDLQSCKNLGSGNEDYLKALIGCDEKWERASDAAKPIMRRSTDNRAMSDTMSKHSKKSLRINEAASINSAKYSQTIKETGTPEEASVDAVIPTATSCTSPISPMWDEKAAQTLSQRLGSLPKSSTAEAQAEEISDDDTQVSQTFVFPPTEDIRQSVETATPKASIAAKKTMQNVATRTPKGSLAKKSSQGVSKGSITTDKTSIGTRTSRQTKPQTIRVFQTLRPLDNVNFNKVSVTLVPSSNKSEDSDDEFPKIAITTGAMAETQISFSSNPKTSLLTIYQRQPEIDANMWQRKQPEVCNDNICDSKSEKSCYDNTNNFRQPVNVQRCSLLPSSFTKGIEFNKPSEVSAFIRSSESFTALKKTNDGGTQIDVKFESRKTGSDNEVLRMYFDEQQKSGKAVDCKKSAQKRSTHSAYIDLKDGALDWIRAQAEAPQQKAMEKFKAQAEAHRQTLESIRAHIEERRRTFEANRDQDCASRVDSVRPLCQAKKIEPTSEMSRKTVECGRPNETTRIVERFKNLEDDNMWKGVTAKTNISRSKAQFEDRMTSRPKLCANKSNQNVNVLCPGPTGCANIRTDQDVNVLCPGPTACPNKKSNQNLTVLCPGPTSCSYRKSNQECRITRSQTSLHRRQAKKNYEKK